MITFRPLFVRFYHLKSSRRLLFIASFLIFFWTFFDGILSYLVPILITQRGFTKTELGLILAFSSVMGAILDVTLSRILKHTNYLKTFLLILAISFIFPLVLWYANHILVYLLAMTIWGLYYDLYTFASYDFVHRTDSHTHQYSFDFGIIELFRSVAGFLAPLLAAWLIIDQVDFSNITSPLIFLIIAALLYVVLFRVSPIHYFQSEPPLPKSSNFFTEIQLWFPVAHKIFPFLIVMVMMYIFDAVFWTAGPLFSASFPGIPYFSGILMTLYNLPSLLTVWKIEWITSRFGKKPTALFSFFLANLFLIPIGFIASPYHVLFLVFLSSVASSITWPAVLGIFADHINQFPHNQSEIEGLTDFMINLGYIFGPIFAGLLSDRFNINFSFAALGLVNIVIILILAFYFSQKYLLKSVSDRN